MVMKNMEHEISLAAHTFFTFFGIPITDVVFATLFVTIALGIAIVLIGKKFAIVPTRFQVFFEFLAGYIYDQVKEGFSDDKEARRFLPFFLTIFIFIMVANQIVLVPFVLQVTFDGIPLLRTPTSTLSGPIALSLTVMILAQVMALRISPLNHLLKFLPFHEFTKVKSFGDFGMASISFFIGLLDIISELAKVMSLAARLFGIFLREKL